MKVDITMTDTELIRRLTGTLKRVAAGHARPHDYGELIEAAERRGAEGDGGGVDAVADCGKAPDA